MAEYSGKTRLTAALSDTGVKAHVARVTGVNASTVTHWAAGGRPNPDKWAKIEQALDKPPGWLSSPDLEETVELLVQCVVLLLVRAGRNDPAVRELLARLPSQTEDAP